MYVSSEQLHPMSILLVDDEPFNIAVLSRMLGRAGYCNVHSTSHPGEAVAMARHCKADLIILDLHMPVTSGFDILLTLSSESNPPEVLVLTADTTTASRVKAISLGARDFLARPVEQVDLLLHTRNLLELRCLHRMIAGEVVAAGQ